MERQYTNEELESFKAMEEFEEATIGHEQLQRELEEKKFMNQLKNEKKSLKYRKFKKKIIRGLIITSAVSSMMTLLIKQPWLSKKEKLIKELAIEADIHGGFKNVDSDKYIYDLDEHLETGKCLIEGEGTPKERIEKICNEYKISDSVTDAIISRYELNIDNEYKQAQKINPLKIYQEEQEELKKQEQNNSYGM